MKEGRTSRRIARLLACACAILAGVAPATASAQPAVDEYTLDIPGGGSNPADPSGTPSAGAAGSSGAAAGESGGGAGGATQSGKDGDDPREGDGAGAADGRTAASEESRVDEGGGPAIGTDSRSAPEVVADTLLDGAMLPLLGALVLIAGVGAWRVLRHRRTLPGAR